MEESRFSVIRSYPAERQVEDAIKVLKPLIPLQFVTVKTAFLNSLIWTTGVLDTRDLVEKEEWLSRMGIGPVSSPVRGYETRPDRPSHEEVQPRRGQGNSIDRNWVSPRNGCEGQDGWADRHRQEDEEAPARGGRESMLVALMTQSSSDLDPGHGRIVVDGRLKAGNKQNDERWQQIGIHNRGGRHTSPDRQGPRHWIRGG